MRVHVLRTRHGDDDSWTNRAVFDGNARLDAPQRLGLLLRGMIGPSLEVAVDTFEVDDPALPIVNEMAVDGSWRVENRNGDLVDRSSLDRER